MRGRALGQIIGPESKNRLLATLAQKALWALRPHLEPIPLARGAVLCQVYQSMRRVYFVESGVVSLLIDRPTALVAMVGRDGAVGGPTLLLGGGIAFGRYQVLASGSALAMEAPHFQIALRQNPNLRSVCEAYTQAFFAQVLQSVACNARHTVEQRCARWLLMCDDQAQDDAYEVAQDNLTSILGVPRSAADAVVARLRQAGGICLREGLITILDRQSLEATACECYRRARDQFERILPRTYGSCGRADANERY